MTTAVSCEGGWLLLHRRLVNAFVAYKIDDAGISSTPVISNMSYAEGILKNSIASIKVSPDTKRVLLTVYNGTGNKSFVILADFDIKAGEVSNERLIDVFNGLNFYSSAFSSNSNMAYVSAYSQKSINQYDVSLPTANAVSMSKQVIYASTDEIIGDLQLGPDSNIYAAAVNKAFVGRINNSNTTAPVYVPDFTKLPAGLLSTLSLPQSVLYPGGQHDNDSSISNNLVFCKGDEINVKGREGFEAYLWRDGSTTKDFIIRQPGKHWVTSSKECQNITDTFNVDEVDLAFELGNDTVICAGSEFAILAPIFEYPVDYKWQNNSPGNTFVVKEQGIYHLTVSSGDCRNADTLEVWTKEKPAFDLGPDTLLCEGYGNLLLDATAVEDSEYEWSVAGNYGLPSYEVINTGLYWASAENMCGIHADTVEVVFKNCDCDAFVPSGFTPNNDGLNESVKPFLNCEITSYNFIIVNRFGEVVFRSGISDERWDGSYKGQNCDLGTYYYQVRIKNVKGKDFLYKGDITLIR